MKIVRDKISLDTLNKMSKKMFDNFVKAVIDVDKEIMAIDAPMHSDEETELIKLGSKQESLWGINLYPELFSKKEWIEFDSLINLRPSQENRTRGINDLKIRQEIIKIVNRLVKK